MKKFFLFLGMVGSLISYTSAYAKTTIVKNFETAIAQCSDTFQIEDKQCSETWSIKCHNYRMQANRNVQKCYKKIALDLFVNFYGLSETEAQERFDSFSNFIYNQYLFVFSETKYCKENNCGTSLYLYSEYATTQELQQYVNRIISSISANN